MDKLNQFIAQVKNVGMSRTNRYSVIMAPPQNEWMAEYRDLEEILLFCDQVQLPGVNLATVQNRTFGEFREVPYEKLFGEISMSFYVDQSLVVKQFFDAWMNSIQNPYTRTFAYYNSYITQMDIQVEDVNDNTRYTVTAYECYPKTVSAIQMDYANKDVMKLQVTMQYKYWTAYGENSNVNNTSSAPMELGDVLMRNNIIPESYYNNFVGFQQDYADAKKLGETMAGYGW